MSALDRFFNQHKGMRRLLLVWVCWLITVVVLRVTDIEALPHVTAPVATVVTAVLGLLTVVIGLYQTTRAKEDRDVRD